MLGYRLSKLICFLVVLLIGLGFFFLIPEANKTSSEQQVLDQPPVVFHQPVQNQELPSVPLLTEPLQDLMGPIVVPPIDTYYDPNSSIIFAIGDLTLIDPSIRPFIRYLSLYNVPKKDRQALAQTVSFVINSLSRRRHIYIPVFVGASDETLIRINLRDYDIDPKAWDEMAEKGSGVRPYPEPYFHAIIAKQSAVLEDQKVVEEKKLANGTIQKVDVIKKVPVGVQTNFTYVQAPWLDPTAVATLTKECHTPSPVMRADWFIANAIVPPAYFNLLGLGKNIKDFDNLVFGNDEVASKARSQVKAIVLKSIVARNNRTLTRSPTLGSSYGYIWRSKDSLSSVNDRDYAKRILDEKFDATEDIATLPNGLQVYFVTDGKGNRVDFADPNVAVDNTAVDRIVRVGRSCMICHSDGIRPIDDEIRSITKFFKDKESIKLISTDENSFYKVQDLFGSDLARQVARDQQNYADAVGLATGLDPQRNAGQLSAFYNGYSEELLTKETVAREVGIPLPDLERYIRGIQVDVNTRIGSNDNIVLGLIKNPVRAIRRDQWESSFSQFMRDIMAMRQYEMNKTVNFNNPQKN